MRATGIVRRIDDLGRIAVPKEIRRQLNIRNGDPLELFIEGSDIIWRKYSSFSLSRYIDAACTVLSRHNITYAIYDCDRILSTNRREVFLENLPRTWGNKRSTFEVDSLTVFPIIDTGEVVGFLAVKDFGSNKEIADIVVQMIVELIISG
jgi:AbrB family looped-hinge helix DNA binding protein